MGVLKVINDVKRNAIGVSDVIPISSESLKQQVVLPDDCGTLDVIKGDLKSLSDNAQNFVIESVSYTHFS